MKSRLASQERWRKLARDVGVNVIANLIAGAAIYLLGVMFGFFQSNPLAIGISLLALGFVVPLLIPAARGASDGGRWRGLSTAVFFLVFMVVFTLSILKEKTDEWRPWIVSFAGTTLLVMALAEAWMGLRRRSKENRRRRRSERPTLDDCDMTALVREISPHRHARESGT